jgi:hypothetical protein
VVEAGDGIAVNDIGDHTYVVSTNGVAPVSKGGTGSGSVLVGDRVMLSDGSGQSIYESPPLFDGYLLVGTTGSAPVSTTLTAGDGIIVATGPGTISVSATGTCAVNQTFSHTCLDISGEDCSVPVQASCIPQALSLDSLNVAGTTTLGTTTTCAAALADNCVTISGKSCPGGALGTNCIPQDLMLNSLYVNNLIAINSTQQTIIDANATSIQVQELYADNIHLNGTLQCVTSPLSTDCVDISGHSCPGGALDASCLPADAVFGNLQSTGTLTVNTVACLGGAIPNNCVDISGKTCSSTLSSTCIPLRVATINTIAPEASAGDFGITSGTGIVITPAANGIVIGNTGVTSVALSVPAIFDVTGSPVTTTGTLTASLATQSANTLFAGPTVGAAAAPAFRTQVLADLPQLTNGQLYVGSTGNSVAAATLTAGTGISVTNGAGSVTVANTGVTSVALSVPAIFSVSGSPVTTTGTLTASLATQSANTLFAGPTTGAAAAPTFRTQVLADLPQLTDGQLYVGSTGTSVAAATLTAGTGISVTNGAGSVTVANTGVTSVALSVPAIFDVTGSPVTTTGTLTASLATQSANTLFAGPTTGAAAAPAFRTQVLADLPQLTDGQLYVGSTGTSVAAATLTAGTGISVTNGAGSITIAATGGGGTVTSVALSLPSIITVSGSPVTTSGTLTGTLATQTANTVFAGPTSGGAAAPTFRALGIADLSSALNAVAVTSDSSATTNNAGYNSLMSNAPAVGTYLVMFSGNVAACSGCTLNLVLTVAGVNMPGTAVTIVTTTRLPVSMQGLATVAVGGQAVSVDWSSSPAGVTTCYSRSLTLVRVA